jgi:tetratricopeptide (TPR) repeat protein
MHPAHEGTARMVRGCSRALLLCICLCAAIFTAFWPVLRASFINLDDPEYVTNNPRVATGLNWANVEWAFQDVHLGNWHPLTWLSHMMDVQIFGLSAGGHHFTSTVFHAANAVLVFLLVLRLTSAFWRSAAVAALFALHPLHVESVAWVAERKDVLSTFFGLLCLMAYVNYARTVGGTNRRRWYVTAVILFTCALMSKSILVTLPLIMLLLDFWPLGRWQNATLSADATLETRRSIDGPNFNRMLLDKLPFLGLSFVIGMVTFSAQKTACAVKGLEELPLADRACNALVSYWRYVEKLVWPSKLAIFYPFPERQIGWHVAGAILFLMVASITALLLARRAPYVLFGWLWYLLTVTPVIGFVQTGMQSMADRYTYVPLIGLFILPVWGTAELAQRRPWRSAVACCWVAALAGALVACAAEARYWESSETLFRRAVAVTADNAFAHNCLGSALAEQRKLKEAINEFKQAIKIRPDYNLARLNLAKVLAETGESGQALREIKLVMQREPKNAEARLHCGNLFVREGRTEEAIAQYEEAVRLNPDLSEAQNNLGNALQRRGQPAEAISHYRAALKATPAMAETHNNLGSALAATGKSAEAIEEYNAALHFNPNYAEAHYNLANAMASAGRWDSAVSNYEAAIRLRPHYPKALIALSTIYGGAGGPQLQQPAKSLELAKMADESTGGADAVVIATLAEAYAANGMLDAAGVAARRALTTARLNGQTNLADLLEVRMKTVIK